MVFVVILVLLILFCFACLKIVPEANQYVVEFLGSYKTTWDHGLHVKIPFLERVANKVSLKEQVCDFPPQPVITKDNVTMQIDTVVYFKVFDAKSFTYGVVYPVMALENLTATTLRNIIGELELDETLTSRDVINEKMQIILDEATDKWGIKVNRVELKNILPPKDIQEAMEKQMRAEREKRQTLLEAEAHKQSSITRAEGDKAALILHAEAERDAAIAKATGEAESIRLVYEAEAKGIQMLKNSQIDSSVMTLKKLEALKSMGDGRATKIIVPTDLAGAASDLTFKSEILGFGNNTPVDTSPKVTPAKNQADACCDVPDRTAVTREIAENK